MGPLKITISPGVLCKGFTVMSETSTCKEHNSVFFLTGYCSSQNQQDPAHEHAKTPQIKERKESGQKNTYKHSERFKTEFIKLILLVFKGIVFTYNQRQRGRPETLAPTYIHLFLFIRN